MTHTRQGTYTVNPKEKEARREETPNFSEPLNLARKTRRTANATIVYTANFCGPFGRFILT